jgi:hypothetical protein
MEVTSRQPVSHGLSQILPAKIGSRLGIDVIAVHELAHLGRDSTNPKFQKGWAYGRSSFYTRLY